MATTAPRGDAAVDVRTRWHRWLFLGVLAAYLFTAAGQFQTIDAAQELSVAVSIRAGRGVQSDYGSGVGGHTDVGRNGWTYGVHDIGSSLAYLPLTLVPGTIDRLPPSNSVHHERLLPSRRLFFVASFLPPLFGALIVLVFARLVGELGFDPVTSATTALLVAFASTIWVFAHISFDVTLATLALLTAVWFLIRFRKSGAGSDALILGACLGASVIVRVDSLVMVAVLVLPTLPMIRSKTGKWRARVAAAVFLPIVVGIAIDLTYNWWRFGSVTDNGHRNDPWLHVTNQVGKGIYGQVLSPGKGLLVFSPILIVALFAWRWFIRKDAVLALSIIGACGANIFAHALTVGWAGDQAWGSRIHRLAGPPFGDSTCSGRRSVPSTAVQHDARCRSRRPVLGWDRHPAQRRARELLRRRRGARAPRIVDLLRCEPPGVY